MFHHTTTGQTSPVPDLESPDQPCPHPQVRFDDGLDVYVCLECKEHLPSSYRLDQAVSAGLRELRRRRAELEWEREDAPPLGGSDGADPPSREVNHEQD